METSILPGFSAKNKAWAEQVKKKLGNIPSTVVYYPHWKSGSASPSWIEDEVDKLATKSNSKTINILAKSAGTLVAMHAIKSGKVKVGKFVLCGIPTKGLDQSDKDYYNVLSSFPTDNLLVIQNENDYLGSKADVQKFLEEINPEIKVVSKPRDDHDYSYFENFTEFLSP